MAKDKPKTKRPYVKVRLVPEDADSKDHGFYYYAFKPGKGEKKNQKLKVRKYDPVSMIPLHVSIVGGLKKNYHHTQKISGVSR